MKNLKIVALILAACAGPFALVPAASAEDKPAFKDDREKASYSVGMTFGNQIKRSHFDLDIDVVTAALKDVLAGRELKMTDQQARETIMAFQQETRKKISEQNNKAGEAYAATYKTKDGVKSRTVTLPDGRTAEMLYRVISEGTGANPKSNDVVTVNYRGTLLDGKEFDSSAKRGGGQPSKFTVNRVVKGWTEALQLMKAGSKWELLLPSTLAYGETGSGQFIEPGASLLFEMELVGIEAPQATPAPTGTQPLTSDIIRVPSADELKKGAKIEVIKPEDAKAASEAAKTK